MKDLTIKELIAQVMEQAKEKGFGTTPEEIIVAEKIALIHSEVSEAFEAYRHKNIDGKHGFKEELADVILRVLHLCGAMNIDIENEITKKFEFNKTRNWDPNLINENLKS